MRFSVLFVLIFCLCSFLVPAHAEKPIVVGSKKFPESYILAEIMVQLLQDRGFQVEKSLGLGGTSLAYTALVNGDVDVYPEYTGTILEAIVNDSGAKTMEQAKPILRERGVKAMESFGFNNTFALAVIKPLAKKDQLKTISDLKGRPYRMALGHEFYERSDGWKPLSQLYGLGLLKLERMEHSLAYEAIGSGVAEVMEVYSTDAKIKQFDLFLLEDNLNYFPEYYALPVVRLDLPQKAEEALQKLQGRISEEKMMNLNAQAVIDNVPFAEVARQFLVEEGLIKVDAKSHDKGVYGELFGFFIEHLYLAFIPILLAFLVALPTAIALLSFPKMAQPIMGIAGLMQTIPSLALLVFMIPYFGTGTLPALVALFLYSILPILRNSYTALSTVDPKLIETARGLGLYPREILTAVKIPLALPVIIAGVRTAAVINIGLATIAAFIGAGGLGEPIVTGLALNNIPMILRGAIPAALLAIAVELAFEGLEKRLSYSS